MTIYKLFGKAAENCLEARAFMLENGVPHEKIKSICDIIASASFKGTNTKVPESMEGKIVQDADRLNTIGAIGITRAFLRIGAEISMFLTSLQRMA